MLPAFVDHKSNPNGQLSTLISFYFSGFSSINAVMNLSNSNTEFSRFPNSKEVNSEIGVSSEPLGFGKPAFGSVASSRSKPRLVKLRKPKGRMEAGGKNDSGFNPFRPGSDDSVPEMGSSVLGKLNFGHVGSSENFVFGGTKNTNVENSSGFLANKTLDDMGKLKIGSDQEVVSTSVSKSNGNDRGSFSHVGSFGKEIPVFGGAFNGSGIDESAVRKLPEEIGKLNIEGSANSGSSKNVRDVSSNLSAPNKTSFIFGSSDDAAKSFGISVASELPNELNKLNIGTGSSSLGRSSAATVLPEKTMNLNMKDPVNTYGGERKDDNFSANDQSGFVFSSNNRGSSGIFYGKADSMLSDEMEKLNIAKQGGDNTGQRQTCFAEDSMGNLGSKNSDDLFKPVRDFIEVPSVVRPEKKDEFNFTSSWNGMGTPHVEFTTPNLKGNIFPGLDKKLEFSAKLESTKDARSKKRRGKLKKPASAQPLFGLDFVFPKSSSQENPDSFDVYSPMDVSPYQEILADNKGSRETSVTSEEAFHPFINDASCESHQTVPNDATDEDLVFATQRMDINNDDRKCTQTEVGDSEYRFGKEDGARSPSPESVVGADSESFKTANEQLESSTDSFVTATDNEVSSRLRIERQESDEKMQFSFTSASEDVAGTSFMFAASSSLQGQSSAAMRHQKKKNRAKVVQESYSSSTPNTKVLPAPSSTQFFPNSDTTKLLSLRPQRGDLPSSLSSRRDKTEAAEQQESKQSSTPAASIAAQEACDKWRLRGNQAYANGDMSRAEDYYTQGVNCVSEKENSKSCLRALMLCYSNRAATRMSLGRMREALADCMQAAAVDPNFLRVQVRAANCYLALGEVEDASRHFMKCLQPGSEACVDRKLVLEASEGLKKAQKVSECMKQSAELLQQRTSSDAESALGVIAQALAISPYCEKLLEMKANALFMLRKFDELIQLCEQTLGFAEMNYPAISADSRSLNASFRVWRLRLSIKSYFYLGRLEDALDYLKKQEECVSTNKESESKTSASLIPLAGTITELVRHKTAGNEAFQSGRHTEAVEHYTAALSCTVESRPFAAVCFCNRAAAYMAMGQIVDAIADCSLAIALDGNYMKAISRRAILFEMIRDYDQAAADLQKLVSILMKKVEDKANQSGASDRSSSLNELRQAQQRLSAMEEEARKEIPLNMYLILGIDPSVVASEIKKAYRKAALRHHPDKAGQSLARSENGDDGLRKEVVEEVHKGADRLFKMIGEAYAVLSDPNKRSRYDLEEEMRNAQKRGNGGSASRMHADVQNYPFERSGSRRQWREVWRSYGNSQSRGSETNRSSRYP